MSDILFIAIAFILIIFICIIAVWGGKCRFCGSFNTKITESESIDPLFLGGKFLKTECLCKKCGRVFFLRERYIRVDSPTDLLDLKKKK